MLLILGVTGENLVPLPTLEQVAMMLLINQYMPAPIYTVDRHALDLKYFDYYF